MQLAPFLLLLLGLVCTWVAPARAQYHEVLKKTTFLVAPQQFGQQPYQNVDPLKLYRKIRNMKDYNAALARHNQPPPPRPYETEGNVLWQTTMDDPLKRKTLYEKLVPPGSYLGFVEQHADVSPTSQEQDEPLPANHARVDK